MEFPPAFENCFRGRGQLMGEKVMTKGKDRRQRIPAAQGCDWFEYQYPDIGLLRMAFNGKCSTGTATLIAGGTCLLTCAHNVVDYDPTANNEKFTMAEGIWFEIRNNNPEEMKKEDPKDWSTEIARYTVNINTIAVHDLYYSYPNSYSGFDLALCWIDVPEKDTTLRNDSYSCSSYPVAVTDWDSKASVVGFPGEYEGEKWGMVGSVDIGKYHNRVKPGQEMEILLYDEIDTTEGQSGSPVMLGIGDIIGVHTGGNEVKGKNWATLINTAKLEWIEKKIIEQKSR